MTKKTKTEMIAKEFRVMLRTTKVGDDSFRSPELLRRVSTDFLTRVEVEGQVKDIAKEYEAGIKAGRIASYELWIEAVTVFDIAFQGKREMPEAQPDSHTWVKSSGNLVKGDILRFRVSNPALKEYGQYAYAICTGEGFGCDSGTHGSAIFVEWVGYDFNEVMSHKQGDECPPERFERWERRWNLDVLKEM
jgi:hypothetical protein